MRSSIQQLPSSVSGKAGVNGAFRGAAGLLPLPQCSAPSVAQQQRRFLDGSSSSSSSSLVVCSSAVSCNTGFMTEAESPCARLQQQRRPASGRSAARQQQQRVAVAAAAEAPSAPAAPSSPSPAPAAAGTAVPSDLATPPSTANGKLISKTEVAAFIQRDDLMDQMYRWAIIEAGEAGVRNFGLPMNVEPFYLASPEGFMLWGYKVGMFKEGTQVCELAIMFDQDEVSKHEWVGRGDDGFPVLEGQVKQVNGKHFEIWKLCTRPVDEPLRETIRSFCTGLVTALNRYYAFGSIFVDDAQ